MMYKYFKNVVSFDDLKSQFKALAKANHPDAGGDAEVMKQINTEYDALFMVWKNKSKVVNNETAESTRTSFYQERGWKGENYDPHLDLKDIASIIREHLKKTYPNCKFSVRMDRNYNRMNVTLMSSPFDIFADKSHKVDKWGESYSAYGYNSHQFTAEARKMMDEIIGFVNSYTYDYSDSMIDYFCHGFYFLGVNISADFKVTEPKKTKASSRSGKAKTKASKATKLGDEYDIKESVHTKTGETIWVVKLNRTLDRAEYLQEAQKMKGLGGYYSKFVHGFVFKADPTKELVA